MPSPPTGTVTFLFTDIEGSGRLWRDHRESMSIALARHDEIVRGAIESNRGYVFSTGGDGFAAAFSRARDAIRSAAEAQERLGVENWPAGAVIRVRMGIHTGEAEERDGDYFGPAVNHTARLMAIGRGGHVLLSDLTADLVGGEAEIEDIGRYEIRDQPRPVRVHALQGPGLRSDRPPAGEQDAHESEMVSFAGVEVDIAGFVIRRDGEPVPVEPQVFDVLEYLIRHRDRVVTKEELLDNVWGDRFVSESALTTRVKSARQAVGDDGRRQEVIRTVHGRGYQFVAPITTVGTDADPAEARPEAVEPVASRPLIARSRELAEVTELLGANRLVTLIGPGGVGKTRLAGEIARRWERDRDDRVVFVPLSPLSGSALVASAMSDAVGVDRAGTDAASAIREALRGQSALIVLDNFEHVVAAAPLLTELMEAAPDLRFLVTSRERLRLTAEQLYQLEPLDVTSDGEEVTDTGIPPALALFEQAAATTSPEFRLGPDNREDVAAICEMLDGLPLAVELAAAQLRYLPLGYLRTHLESNASTMADGAHDRPERHRSVRDTIAWSYALLSRPQQRLLSRLSVFAGGWSLDAAEAVVGDDGADVMGDLFALVDKSLVRPVDGRGGAPRWTLLHLVREFASDLLEDSNEAEGIHRRHARYFAESIEATTDSRWDRDAAHWVASLGEEFRNIETALGWAFDHSEPVLGCRIVAGLGVWWYKSGHHADGRRWVGVALDHLGGLDPSTAGRLHLTAGVLAYADRNLDRARDHFERALERAEETGDRRVLAFGLCNLAGTSVARLDELEDATELVDRGLAEARSIGDRGLVADGLNAKGELMRLAGDLDAAETAYREALELNQAIGDRHYEAISQANLGHVALARGDIDGATPFMRAGLEISLRLGSRVMAAWSVSEKALLYQKTGDPETGARLIGGAEAALEALGARRGPADQPVHEATRAALVEDLGESRFGELVREGAEMTLDESVALALTGL